MAHLVVLGVDNRDDAERLFDLAGDLAKQELLQLEDAAYAYKDAKGKVRIHQAVSLTGAGAASGALWGTLIGLIFLVPVAGLAIGAASGRWPGSWPTWASTTTPSSRSAGSSTGAGRPCSCWPARPPSTG